MFPIPSCPHSKHKATKFCVSQQCTASPFMCLSCPNELCENLHQHEDKLQIIKICKLEALLEANNQMFSTFEENYGINFANKIVAGVLDQLKTVLQNYVEFVNTAYRNVIQSMNIHNTITRLRDNQPEQITGNDMRFFYDSLKMAKQEQLKSQLQQMLKTKSDKLIELSDNLKAILDDYSENRSSKKPEELKQKSISNEYDSTELAELRKLTNKIIKQPQLYVHVYNRAIFYEKLGRYQEAIRDYNTALTLKPNDKYLLNNRGAAYDKFGKVDNAKNDYLASIQICPSFWLPHYNLSLLLVKSKQYQEALTQFTLCIKLNSRDSKAYHGRGQVYLRLNRLTQALQDLSISIDKDPENVMAYSKRAEVYSIQENFKMAIRDYTKAISLYDSAELLAKRAELYLNAGQYAKCAADLDQIKRLDQNFPQLPRIKSLLDQKLIKTEEKNP